MSKTEGDLEDWLQKAEAVLREVQGPITGAFSLVQRRFEIAGHFASFLIREMQARDLIRPLLHLGIDAYEFVPPVPERYTPNGTPLTPYEDEILTVLMEECAEVIVAASKLKRFGKENRPDDGESNSRVLGLEIGDALQMFDQAQIIGLILSVDITDGHARKKIRLKQYLQHQPDKDVQ